LSICVVGIAGAGVMSALGRPEPITDQMHSARFAGPKANTGMVTHSTKGASHILTLSDDFKVPDTPDPHWQLVDSKGAVYQLDKLMLKGDRVARTITVPAYVPDVQKVVIWCAWAEANLGEASFGTALKTK
jgi:hypothetical protein